MNAVYLDPSKRVMAIDVVLKGGTTVSDPIDLQNFQLRAIIVPVGGFDGAIKFNAAAPGIRFVPKGPTDGTYLPVQILKGAGTDLSISVNAGKFTLITDENTDGLISALSALRYIELVYADPGSDKTITLVCVASLN